MEMSKIHSFWKFVLHHKLWVGVAVVVIGGGTLFAFHGSDKMIETVSPERADLVRIVRISGKVAPRERVDLGFEISGTVSSVPKDVGDTVLRGEALVRLDAGTKAAEIRKAEAELASAQAELNQIEGTAVYENSITNNKRSVVQAIKSAYTTASEAVYAKADQVFIDPNTFNPVIKGSFKSSGSLYADINDGRVKAGETLEKWGELVAKLPSDSYTDSELSLSKTYLTSIITFINNVSTAVNLFEVTSYMTQSEIDGYKSALLSARESLNAANDVFISAESGLSQTLSSVPVQVSRVEAAQAALANLQFQLGKSTLISPISGVVAAQEAKLGEALTAGASVVSVISHDYVIETYVPEVSIAGIAVGNKASVTFDAYGSDAIFAATVEKIDPAETIRDGVSTYKVKLAFVGKDARVRSGLTSNVEIETLRKPEVVLIPERAVAREGEESFVYVLRGESREKVAVSLGLRDSRGNVELLSELPPETQIVVNP